VIAFADPGEDAFAHESVEGVGSKELGLGHFGLLADGTSRLNTTG
jgi:hypothetical protein